MSTYIDVLILCLYCERLEQQLKFNRNKQINLLKNNFEDTYPAKNLKNKTKSVMITYQKCKEKSDSAAKCLCFYLAAMFG